MNESRPISTEIPPLNNIAPSSDDHSDPSTGDNSALHVPNAPLLHTFNVDFIDVCLEGQPDAHRLDHQLTFEQFPEKQIEQPSFNDQIKEHRKKHKKSSHDQYKERTNSKRKKVNFPRSHRRYNRQLKSPSNDHYAKNSRVGYVTRPEKRYNFCNLASNRRPPDWNNYLNLVYQATTLGGHQSTLV